MLHKHLELTGENWTIWKCGFWVVYLAAYNAYFQFYNSIKVLRTHFVKDAQPQKQNLLNITHSINLLESYSHLLVCTRFTIEQPSFLSETNTRTVCSK